MEGAKAGVRAPKTHFGAAQQGDYNPTWNIENLRIREVCKKPDFIIAKSRATDPFPRQSELRAAWS